MLNRGSEWRRWEPHIHAPGTVMNNQFGGPSAWHDYLAALEQATPVIEAIAVTDYYVTDTYEEVLKAKGSRAATFSQTDLSQCRVEARRSDSQRRIRQPPPVSSVPRTRITLTNCGRLLSRLQFNVMQDRFDCTRADLIRLGKKADPTITDDGAALTFGANQFKVNFQKLRDVFSEQRMGKEEYPDCGSERCDRRHIRRAGGCGSNDPTRN